MRFFFLAMVLIFPVVSSAMSFPTPDGTYTGSGTFVKISDGSEMTYTVSYEINSANDAFSVSYVYANGFNYTLSYNIVDGAQGEFTIKTLAGATAGSGSCIQQTCQWTLSYVDSQFGQVNEWGIYVFDNNGGMEAVGHNMTSGIVFNDFSQLTR